MTTTPEHDWRALVDEALEREHERQERRGDDTLSIKALSLLIDASRADDADPATRARAALAVYRHRLEDAQTDSGGQPLHSARDATRARAAQILARFIHHATLDLFDSLGLQADLLADLDGAEDDAPTLLALANLWARAPWAARRALLSRASDLDDPRLLPAYARAFSSLDVNSRLIVTRACSRLDDLAAEPILCAALLTPDLALATHAARALARTGTPAALRDLHAARSLHPASLLPDLDRATELILERHPVRSSSGDLSLVDDELHGALSYVDAPEGQISLYNDVLDATSSGLPDPDDLPMTSSQDHQGALTRASQWEALPLAPRPVPLPVRLGLATHGTSPLHPLTLTLAYPAILVTSSLGPLALPASIAAALAPLLLGAYLTRRATSMLAHGTPALALVTPHPDGLTLEYLSDSGRLRSRTVAQNALGTLGDERLEPVLFSDDDDLALDELLHVDLRDGHLVLSPRGLTRTLAILATHLLVCAWLIATHAL
jgi:hypothetical protein